jgi:hypothetical protein
MFFLLLLQVLFPTESLTPAILEWKTYTPNVNNKVHTRLGIKSDSLKTGSEVGLLIH